MRRGLALLLASAQGAAAAAPCTDPSYSTCYASFQQISYALSTADPTKPLAEDRGCPKGTSQCLRFLKSKDALNWEYMYTLHPDPKWYKNSNGVSKGRWDHAYIQEDTQRGGFIAFPVATPTGSPAPGQLRSADGLNWSVEAPTVVDFGDVIPTAFEIGGVEKMSNGRYYMIGGGGGPPAAGNAYSMWVLRSNGSDVAGPYAPDSMEDSWKSLRRLRGGERGTSMAARGASGGGVAMAALGVRAGSDGRRCPGCAGAAQLGSA